ncbi:hypothetical protein [Pontiella agarivorans]|uniref:Fibronectin type-III domain-containing protein n=1 Tax=Pontiella agarivorans TaxID=3038953 RepID=A0ABU5MS82_9BACT|nr:hypothetical protein [Pontiella agarivorans]MDZ8117060.1 hypothetical protein [Pontiella agarivorans]
MKKWTALCLTWVAAVGVQANLFKTGWTNHGSNEMNYDHLDVGWNTKTTWDTNATGFVNLGPTDSATAQFGQVFSVNSSSDTGDVATLSFDWTPSGSPNTNTTLKYQLIGWNEDSPLPAASSNFFYSINWGGSKVGTLGGTHERVDLINGGAGSTADNQNMTMNTVTADAGITQNYSITFNVKNAVAGISDFSDYEFVGIRFGIDGADSNAVNSVVENISLTLSNSPPISTVGGQFINTSFTGVDYVDGDLAGQDNWVNNANDASAAFTVNTGGSGFAEGLAASAKTNGASVYWSEANENTAGATWSGSVNFIVAATNAPTVARSGDGALIADFNASDDYPLFSWGVSSDVAGSDLLEAHPVSGFAYTDDALLRAWLDVSSGGIRFNINGRFYSSGNILTLSGKDLKWAPMTTNTNETPDFVTELIECDWMIRKSTAASSYNASLTVTVGTNVYEGVVEYTYDDPETLYNAEAANFVMQHLVDAVDLLDVSVDAVSVSHTNASPVPVSAPYDLAATTGNLEINLSWLTRGGEESGGFNVYRSSTGIEPGDFTLLTNLSGTAFTDTDGLTTKTTYIYRIAGVFPTGESEYSELAVFALAQSTVPGLFWGDDDDLLSGNVDLSLGAASTLNGIDLYTGGGVDGSFAPAVSTTPTSGSYNTSACPLLYGWVQLEEGEGINQIRLQEHSSGDILRWRDNDGDSTTNASLFYVEVETEVDVSDGVLKVQSGEWGNNTRVAIRNNGIWYASATITDNSIQLIDLATETWAVFSEPAAGDDFVDVTGASFAVQTFDQVDAVGILRGKNADTVNSAIRLWDLVVGDKPSAFQTVMYDYGVYNADAAFTNDYDGDGISNGEEWGLNGNPTDSGSVGITARRRGVDGNGNFLFIHPRLKAEPRPIYNIVADDNLVIAPDFSLQTEGVDYTRTSGGQWVTNNWAADFEAVTNAFPLQSVEFFKLEVTEP